MKTDKRERPSFKQKQSGQRRQSLSSSTRDGRKKRPLKKEGSSDSFLICGRNSVSEFLKSRGVRRVFLKEGKKDDRLLSLAALAEKQGVPVEEVKEENLDDMSGGVVHQGIAALLKPYEYADLDRVLADWEGKSPILILLDGLEDVRNLGAIVRTAECAGAAAVLLPKHKSPPVTAAAMKTAAGAFAYLPVCQTGNIRQTLEMLKGKGFWVVGADMDGESLYYDANLKGPLVIVMGAEGKGVSPLTRKMCDFCVRIPMKGKVSSLNVSVAAALLIYEAAKQRDKS
ncbi:23S rRNA (guanosine(2251)-2'-O)-methyltransferase RlmB [uncultured Dialister sp.]|uniref:23S rRNA (guanosine(2251)-2'-O)-methyltransferase RlmB n=1 Tax=uncultured Dialister sp. TaxID=278064 RepID=UPI00265CA2FF|nr:23S rRNA (guanosine(2251)-2'-O)-methyltransferase RlmB [uncultured Dialister sp.]